MALEFVGLNVIKASYGKSIKYENDLERAAL